MLFDKKIDPSCSYCKRGSVISEDEVVCRRNGVVAAWHSCRRFQYDPLRRVPPQPMMPGEHKFTKKDFEL